MSNATPRCPDCGRPRAWCVCALVVALPTVTRVLVLQHPGEIDEDLGTAGLLAACLPACQVKPGLSWASLSHALDHETRPSDWGLLWGGSLPRPLIAEEQRAPVLRLDRRGRPVDGPPLAGIVALDGTWSQAKALAWRNPWLLKLQRILLHPVEPSVYGRLRREPRREALSTLEAVADALVANGEDPRVRAELRRLMRHMCQRARDAGSGLNG